MHDNDVRKRFKCKRCWLSIYTWIPALDEWIHYHAHV